MQTYTEHARELPVVAQADVIVVGGGPGGLSAAVAAARHGASVLLVERYGFLGGLATAGLVAPILGHTASRVDTPGRVVRHTEPIVEGLLKEMVERMHALGGAPTWEESCWHWGIYFDAEAFKRAADELVQAAGVSLRLHSLVTDAIVEAGRIRGLIIESKSGRQAVMGNTIIDATGDADVAYRSGAETRRGRHFDCLAQAAGWFVHIGGVRNLGEEQVQTAVDKVRAATLRGDLHVFSPKVVKYNTFHRDSLSPNIMRIAGDATDAQDLTRMELEVRESADVRESYPDVEFDTMYADAAAMKLVLDPRRFDVILTTNLYGDILSDLAGAVVGSVGLGGSGNINPERSYPSMFEPFHGTAPDIAGQGIANPIGAIWAGAMMLEHLGQDAAAEVVHRAIREVLAEGARTSDVGGSASTAEAGDAIAKRAAAFISTDAR